MVNVIGLGYIGLPTALMMASHGVEVVGTNHSQGKVDMLKAGKTTFKEKGLDELFQAALDGGIKFTTEYQVADTYIVSVQTPYDEFTKKVDMSYVNAAIDDVLKVAPKGAIIIIESTISPGSIDRYVRPYVAQKGFKIGEDIHLVHAPERIIPGNMVYELLHNDRTIGADDPEIGEKVKELYASFCGGNIVVTDIKTAEMTKVVENTFRCVNIAFTNELAKICRHDNMDVYEVIKICNMHPRVNILNPGPGVGGHCIPVDPWFLVGDYPSLTKVIGESLKVNASMPEYVLERIYEIMEEKGITDVSRIGLYGLTFKENVDDFRESPTLQLLDYQKKHLGQPLKVYDPWIEQDLVKNQYHDLNEFLAETDLVVIMVKHNEIKENMDKLAGKVVLDCHNICNLPGVYHLSESIERRRRALGRVSLYYNTVKNMKPSQVVNRLRIKLGKGCSLGVAVSDNKVNIQKVESPEGLDFDPVFLARFPVSELMEDTITILHSSKTMDWRKVWNFEDKSALWNFNLHYFEYLFPLVKRWRDTGETQYLDKTMEMINGWIDVNPVGTNPAWASYTTALRIVTWISYYRYVSEAVPENFQERLLSSLHDQYIHLSGHLEKDILGNHYFEDLKSLVLAAIFFKDEAVLEKAITNFKAECKEEILPDGMHFELSPMYHKIIFEGMLRVAIALRGVGKKDAEIEGYLQSMLNVAYSFEDGLERVPLFNDGGNNVAKSLDALIKTAETLGYAPKFKGKLKESGFYIFRKNLDGQEWKLIVDAGQPGPKYIPGHAHCDAMSFELFCDGKPVVVNCGTYAYQCKERSFFRSTAAHNTVMVDETEQSQCWGAFRLAKRSSTKVLDVTDTSITMEMTDQSGKKVKRAITFSDSLNVRDESEGHNLLSYVHLVNGFRAHTANGTSETYLDPYATDYGKKASIATTELRSNDHIEYTVCCGEKVADSTGKVSADQYKGYKPLAFLKRQLYFYKAGKLWTVRNAGMKLVADLVGGSWKDKSRTLIRLFRREPKFAVPIDDHRMIVVGFKKLLMVDVNNKDVQIICESRAGFSDPLNICKTGKNWLMVWGDYGSNPNREAINIYGLKADLTVETVYSFQAGQIRHIHNIIPRLKGGYYIFTGDQETGAGIYTADYDFKRVEPVLTGKQRYRAVVGFDTPDGLLYATDAVNEQNYVYHLKANEPEQIYELNGSCIYGTENRGSYYFATTVEPDENNRGLTSWVSRKRGAGILSDEVKLIEIDNEMAGRIIASYKKDLWPMKLMQYGSIQFPHGESDEMWLYPVAVQGKDGTAIKMEMDYD